MSLESGTPRFLALSPSINVTIKDPNKQSRISYTREFLLSLAKADTVELPREVHLSISCVFEDASGLLSPPFCVPDSRCHISVPQHSSLKVLDNTNQLLHRSNEPYQPQCRYKALRPSSRDNNDLLNSHTSGSSDCANHEKAEQERWRKDTIRLPKDDKWHSTKHTDLKESSMVFLMSSAPRNLDTLQSSSNAITKQLDASQKPSLVQGAASGDALQQPILRETTKNCSTQHQSVQDLITNELQLSNTSVCVHGSQGRIAKSDLSEAHVSPPPPIEDKKQFLSMIDKCESATIYGEGILSLHGVKQDFSISMKQNPSSPGFQIQEELDLNSFSSLDGKSNSSSEICLPDEDSLIRFDEPFLMPDVVNWVDNSMSSPERNPVNADVFSPSSPHHMIEKLVESILNDESSPAAHLDDPEVHHGAELEGFCHSLHAPQSYTQFCSNQMSPGSDQQAHNSFQRNSIDSAIYSSLTSRSFPSSTISQPFPLSHAERRRFDPEVSQSMFQQMTNPGKLHLCSFCVSQSGVTPHLLTLQMASCTQKLNSMQDCTLGYQEPSNGCFIRPNTG